MFKSYIHFTDGSEKQAALSIKQGKEKNIYKLNLNGDCTDISYIDVALNDFDINAGDEGFYLLSGGHTDCDLKDSAIGYFKERPNCVYTNKNSFLPILGLSCKGKAFLAAVTGMAANSCQIIKIENGHYKFFFRIDICGEEPYEPIEITEFKTDASGGYNAMAAAYRKHKIENGFIPLKERCTPSVKYAAKSLLVRIRLGWKPVPCEVKEQTPENEPPMHVACTFADVEKIIKAYKKAGVENAEFSLVGWNVKGHDGRWPQILPPEEQLGGEKGLISLIKTAKENGYTISCHTNSTDSYRIANIFDENDIALTKDGKKSIEASYWAGGTTYNLCPKRAYEISKKTLKEMEKFGFNGLHYIDVITCTPPRECHSPAHPITKKESVDYFDKLFLFAKELFGGISCEGAYEYYLKNCEYILYASFLTENDKNDIVDEYIPFWQLVFHGIIMSNPYSGTINAVISSKKSDMLKLIEYGGRPVIYYYSHFTNNQNNWIADTDFRADTDKEIEFSAKCAKKQEDIYKEMSYLQFEFMEKHKKIADNIYKVSYSDGTEITVDYNAQTFVCKRGK